MNDPIELIKCHSDHISDDPRDLNVRHSYHISEETKTTTDSNIYSKSDLNVALSGSSKRYRNLRDITNDDQSRGEYYKRYEHDEVPVKDSDNITDKEVVKCLTDLDLDKLETRIFSNVSQELQTDESSLSCLESNIKFFKTTVEKIFDNFYNSMSDFEHYKRRFHEILAKSKEGSIDDMEEFIKDMFEHIMSTENSASNISESVKNQQVRASSTSTDTTTLSNTSGVMEAYKNDNYLTDSTFDDKSCKHKGCKLDDIFKVFLIDGNPCVEIKLRDRNLLSEIYLKQPKDKATINYIASAGNVRKVAEKKIELEENVNKDLEMPEREIPVKVSYAKKDIHLDEDFVKNAENTDTGSFLSKICNLLCKKFRKSTLG